jgi:hypothetical protein
MKLKKGNKRPKLKVVKEENSKVEKPNSDVLISPDTQRDIAAIVDAIEKLDFRLKVIVKTYLSALNKNPNEYSLANDFSKFIKKK